VLLEASIGLSQDPLPPGVPASCADGNPEFTFQMPAQVDANGNPIFVDVTFRYTLQSNVYEAIVSPGGVGYTPLPDNSPYLIYNHRFLDALPVNGAPVPPLTGLYDLEVEDAGVVQASLQFNFTQSAAAPASVGGLATSGPLVLPPGPGEDPVALLEDEGDTTSVTITWSSTTGADYYIYELWWLPVDPATNGFSDDFTLLTGPVGVAPPTTIADFSGLGFGVYVFTIEAFNCAGEGGGKSLTKFAVSDPVQVSSLDNFENQCVCDSDSPPMFDVDGAGIETRSGDGVVAVALGANGALADAATPRHNSSANPHPVATASFRLIYDTTLLTLDATFAGGSQFDEPPVTNISGTPVTAIDKPLRVLIPGQLSVPAGASRLADADFDLTFQMPLPNLPDGTSVGTFIGSIEPTAKVPVLDRSLSPFGRRVGLVIDDFLDTTLVGNGGAPALIRGNATIVEYTGIGTSSWDSPAGSFTTIARPGGTGDFIVTNAVGDEWLFDGSATARNGVLKEIRWWTGEKTVFTRSATDRNADGVENDLEKIEYKDVDGTTVIDTVAYTWTGPNITSVTDADGRVWTYSYGAGNRLDSVTGPPSDVVAGLADVPAAKTVFGYDLTDSTYPLNSVEWTDVTGSFSEVTSFTYDQWRNVVTATRESTAGDRTWTISAAESAVLNGQYLRLDPEISNPDPNAVVFVDGPETTITLPNGDISRWEVDLFGNTVRETQNYSNGGYGGSRQAITEFQRNADGQVLKTIGTYFAGQQATALETSYTYDASRRLVNVAYPDGSNEAWTYNAPGLTGPHQPDTYTKQVDQTTTHTTTYTYSGTGQRTSATVTNGAAFMEETHTAWSGAMVTSVILPSVNGGGVSDATRPAIEYFYDNRRRLIHTRRTSAGALNGTPLSTDIWQSNGYDTNGNLAWTTSEYSNATLDGNGLPTGLDDTLKTDVISAALGGVRRMTLPDPDGTGSLTRPEYVYSIDALNRVLTSIDAGPGTVADRTTAMTWNDFGELATINQADPDGAGNPLKATTTIFARDQLGNLSSIKSAIDDDGTVSSADIFRSQFFKYNSRGELEWQSLPYGADQTSAGYHDRTWYDYDQFSRVVRQDLQSGVAGTNDYQVSIWEYKDANRTVKTTDAAGSVWETQYDAIGRVTKTITPDPDGAGTSNGSLTTNITYYDGNNSYNIVGTYARIDGPRDTPGEWAWVKFNPYGQVLLDEPLDPDGSGTTPQMWTRYYFDTFGRLSQFGERYGTLFDDPEDGQGDAEPTERTTDYQYNSRGQVTQITTPDPDGAGLPEGLETVWAYDNLGRNTSLTYPSGMIMNYTWRDDGLPATETRIDGDGDSTNDWFAVYDYDNQDRQISMTTPGVVAGEADAVTKFAYNQRGDLLSETLPDPDGSGVDEESFVTTFAYDTVNPGIFLESVTTSATTGTATTEFVYDRAGRLREQYRPDPVTGDAVVGDPTEKWTWDKLDRLTSESVVQPIATGPYTYDTVSYAWDTLSRITSVSDSVRTETTKYEGNGDVSQVTDALGRVTSYAWDNWGRLTDESRYLDGTVNDVTRTTYDGFGRITDVTENFDPTSSQHIVPPAHVITSWTYDNLDRVTTETNALRLPVASVTTYNWNDKGQLDKITNEYGQPQFLVRDDVGRVTQSRFTNNLEQMDYTFDAYDRVETQSDANGNTTTSVFDNAGRLTQSIGPSVGGTPATVTYAYDTPGNLVSLTDPVGNATTWQYDKRNRMRFETVTLDDNPESRELQYYLNDNVYWAGDRDGDWRLFKYNFALGDYQIKQERWLSAGQFTHDISYEYNAGNGMLLTDVFESGPAPVNNQIEFDYDGLGRVDRVRTYLTGYGVTSTNGGGTSSFTTFDVDYTWETRDQRDKTEFFFSDQSGAKTNEFRNDYTWDKLYRLESVKQEVSSSSNTWVVDAARTRDVDFAYYPNDQLKKITRTQGSNTNELITEYKQNPGDDWWIPGRVSKVEHSGLTQGTQLTDYDFDVAGRIIQKVTPNETYNYAFDDTDQLTLVTDASAVTVQDPNFNAAGNETTYTIGELNRIDSDGTYSYEYDLEGNRTKRTKLVGGAYEEYEWDIPQRLTSVTSYTSVGTTTQKVQYEYDGLNRRFRRKVDTNGDGSFEVNQRLLYDTNPASSPLPRIGGDSQSEGAFYTFGGGPFGRGATQREIESLARYAAVVNGL
jgi:YD repeat-containing protein